MRLAQITDIHLRRHQPGSSSINRRRSRQGAELLTQALAHARAQGAEFVAVTGDLLDVPNYVLDRDDYYEHDWAGWDRDILADYEICKQVLDESGLPYTVLPGNHDMERLLARVFPREPHVWDFGGYRFARFWDREHEGHVPRRFDRERLLFEELLADESGLPQIHLQHYVVTPELSQGYPHSYLEGEELRRRTVASGRVQLSLSGHYHRGTELICEEDCCFATGPVLAEFPYRYRIYELGGSEVRMEEHALAEPREGPGQPVVFLDRDGCINTLPSYRTGPHAMELIPGAAAALRALRQAGYALVLITNQSCVGLGYVSRETLNAVNDQMCQLLQAEGVELDGIYYSWGGGDFAVHPSLAGSGDGKPNPVLLQCAAEELHLDLNRAWMVGDSHTDVEAGLAAGATPILVRTGNGRQTERQLSTPVPVTVVDDIVAASRFIVNCG